MTIGQMTYDMTYVTYANCQTRQGKEPKQATTFQDILGQNGKTLEAVDLASGTNPPQITQNQSSKVPYSALAKDGIVTYNGTTFVCDYERNALCLGDTTDFNQCISIPLSKGGSLIVNRENLGDLSNAIGMFSPEDVTRILTAIAQDKKVQEKLYEAEDQENSIEERTPIQQLKEQIETMTNQLLNGETEATYQIGGQSYTIKQWDKLLEKFDKVQETLKEEKEAVKEAEKEEALAQGSTDASHSREKILTDEELERLLSYF